MKIALAIGVLFAAGVGATTIVWPEGCTSLPPRHWLTPLEVEARLREAGLRMQSIRQDGERCFSVIARDTSGALRSVLVNPADGAVVRSEAVQ